jgi:hypothetical protein
MLCIYEIYISDYAVVCKHSGFLLIHEVITVLSLSLSKISKNISLSEEDNIKTRLYRYITMTVDQ